ncbi:patatin-like phospholipase family protein [Alysiella filiformis]|uniref:Patatin-like phospholipase n=1 Tax=Alysiella filiformis DSM 16848 TaxID=1120981 RepID=A0A286EDT8_9NEIS|nr:patatin-like phospholipase family protein [Alysiella filiformis]QMT31681.1 patatin-like phospholipase family protein [Alysiella filiformis]UBQ55309.1 patatin-like phospholipase family protein [Alysiella filiformis DSM 16848]SOD69075.1 Patatin-like phospholipase [Alysiella filiformis DSM 16848]
MKPYNNLLMFSGGGSRLAYFLGCYAALFDHQRAPDVIVGSCGGSLAAWLVSQAPEPERLCDLLTSVAFYRVARSVWLPRRVGAAAWFQAAWRWWQTGNRARLRRVHEGDDVATLLAHLQTYALFEPIGLLERWLDDVADLAQSLPKRHACVAPDVLISGSRMLESPCGAVLWQQLWFAPPKVCDFWRNHPPLCAVARHAPWRIARLAHVCERHVPMLAVAVSICDMYYQAPVYVDDLGWCMGAVLDLQPVERACDLAHTVWTEHKMPYSAVAHAAIGRVFGTNAHCRHAEMACFESPNTRIHRLPFADNAVVLRGDVATKTWDWRSGCLKVDWGSHAQFVQMMLAQWQYGYTRTADYCARLGSC